MATVLMWEAFELYQNLSNILYKHPVSIMVSQKTCKVEDRWRKLIPFYAVTSLQILHCLLISYILLTWKPEKAGTIPIHILFFEMEMLCIFLLCVGLNYSLVIYRTEGFECFLTRLWQFDLRHGLDIRRKRLPARVSLIKQVFKGNSNS